jgi:hypothetical protein
VNDTSVIEPGDKVSNMSNNAFVVVIIYILHIMNKGENSDLLEFWSQFHFHKLFKIIITKLPG